MSFPQVQFVASPDAGAVVRFDFNTDPVGSGGQLTKVLDDGFSLGAPSLQGDPDGIGAELGLRELSIPLRVNGTAATAATTLATLAREMGRQTNWLRFQATPTSVPYWFQTYRSSPVPLGWGQVRGTSPTDVSQWDVDVKLDADDLAYGARETIGPVTVNNNPAAGTNPMTYALSAVKGDGPAKLQVRMSPVTYGHTGHTILLGSAPTAPLLWQSSSGTAGTDTGTEVANAAFSGGGYRATSFATVATMATRLTFSPLPSRPRIGRHKILVRVARSDTTSTFALRGSQAVGLTLVNGATVTWAPPTSSAGGWTAWVDLGEFAFPIGGTEVDPALGLQATLTDGFSVQAQRLTGTGALWFDAVLVVPIETIDGAARVLQSAHSFGFSPGTNTYWDAELESTYAEFSGALVNFTTPTMQGDYLWADPATGAVLVVMLTVGSGTGTTPLSDQLDEATTVSITYRPRWLYLAAS